MAEEHMIIKLTEEQAEKLNKFVTDNYTYTRAMETAPNAEIRETFRAMLSDNMSEYDRAVREILDENIADRQRYDVPMSFIKSLKCDFLLRRFVLTFEFPEIKEKTEDGETIN